MYTFDKKPITHEKRPVNTVKETNDCEKIPIQTKRDQYYIGKETQQETERDGCI